MKKFLMNARQQFAKSARGKNKNPNEVSLIDAGAGGGCGRTDNSAINCTK